MVGKTAIIQAAISIMRQKTPREMSVLEVATAAGVDPALIRYYFGNKQGLIQATATHLLEEIQSRSRIMLDEEGTLEVRLRKRLRMLIDALKDNPPFLQLVLNEIYAADKQTHSAATLRDVAFKGMELSESLLKQRMGSDAKVQDIDPRFLHVAILGLCTFFMDAQPMLRVLFDDVDGTQDLTERYIDFAANMILKGISKSA
ncbi:TetR/AcrR family transcriptional regulator [Pigmentiphaga litoralis]|uniref:AcrR family transcriptional regulator n=1 Tax=Pigmentiphaga litoralis TaxID=516702 RepID=A0A7Y9IQT5_9BURK|nr:TetR/AcrR family transcriptional regulator [Pigmentiphaga litoralis]NYE25155.1 AcrR family transcriptional regulator [Pigmentiphaga litoralis]NYE81231.1 AcrR family transcriptional regulator [Pigmentiphaga litoralis]